MRRALFMAMIVMAAFGCNDSGSNSHETDTDLNHTGPDTMTKMNNGAGGDTVMMNNGNGTNTRMDSSAGGSGDPSRP